jgi:hypothetical protein
MLISTLSVCISVCLILLEGKRERVCLSVCQSFFNSVLSVCVRYWYIRWAAPDVFMHIASQNNRIDTIFFFIFEHCLWLGTLREITNRFACD